MAQWDPSNQKENDLGNLSDEEKLLALLALLAYDYKPKLQYILAHLPDADLRFNDKDVEVFRNDLKSISWTLKHQSNKPLITQFFVSLDAAYTNIDESIKEFDTILYLYDLLKVGNITMKERAEAIHELSDCLNRCRACLFYTLQQFLIE